MIELTPIAALMLYLCLTVFTVMGLWVYNQFRGRKRKIYLPEKELFICEYCHYAFLDEFSKETLQCPQCFSYNKSKIEK